MVRVRDGGAGCGEGEGRLLGKAAAVVLGAQQPRYTLIRLQALRPIAGIRCYRV
ncbi:hypothetical protein [Mucilaginibacter sp. 44-25]|uniref:hypothetical protein n=1 Tax=Mucilaginibacter sp. 44-25 TaxID=1895794 RepID=UPI0025CF6597|nr:hypothetical protein [Mucilaginibacter sp. 44-25]